MLNIKKFIKRLFNSTPNLENVTISLVNTLNIDLAESDLKEALDRHPNYPSLLSINDVLNEFNILNIPLKLETEKLYNLPTPFIATISNFSSPEDAYVLIKKIDQINVTFSYGLDHEDIIMPAKDFSLIYSGYVLLAEKNEESTKANYKSKISKERANEYKKILLAVTIPFFTFFTMILMWIEDPGLNTLVFSLYSVLSIIGWGASLLLLWHEIDHRNAALLQVCGGGLNQKANPCSIILKSKGAKLFGQSLSMVGFTYFNTILISLIFFGFSDKKVFTTLFLISAMATLFIPYSIYYQWKKIKAWCKLCIVVQLVLFFQLLLTIQSWQEFSSTVLLSNFFFIVLLGLIIFIFSDYFFRIINSAREIKIEYQALRRNKYDPDIFKVLLENGKEVSKYNDLGISFGDSMSQNEILIVCNPYCTPCARTHKIVDNIIDTNKDIKVVILFTATNNPDDERALPVKHFLALNTILGKHKTREALNNWYNSNDWDYHKFAKNYPINPGDLHLQSPEIERMSKWCDRTDIRYTPTIFFKGFQLPSNYDIKDLSILIKLLDN
ncbi:vitamin K epoxide reductase family protein [Sphingobacterium siyangense]|jgi:uncharacterized membrane protein|uniref:vitamin K epoxide reductase family protein n=1 Tax=Sphingobacterium siyangense TaxID=459529 RepID=UPI0028B228B8|nr:vitamin K epoxide reductase family protein [Sphingobacterium siyangense]